MNAIAAHKDELEKLLEYLSSEPVVSRTSFVAGVDAYITRLDRNCSDICASPQAAQIDTELIYGTNLDSKLRALLRATQTFETTRRVFPQISRCGPQASAGYSSALAAWLWASGALPGQRTLIDIAHPVTQEDEVKEIKAGSRTCGQKCNAPINVRGKPRYLFRGIIK